MENKEIDFTGFPKLSDCQEDVSWMRNIKTEKKNTSRCCERLHLLNEDEYVLNIMFDLLGEDFDPESEEYFQASKAEFEKLLQNPSIIMYDPETFLIQGLTRTEAEEVFGSSYILGFSVVELGELLRQKHSELIEENGLEYSLTLDLTVQDFLNLAGLPETFKDKEDMEYWLTEKKWIVDAAIQAERGDFN